MLDDNFIEEVARLYRQGHYDQMFGAKVTNHATQERHGVTFGDDSAEGGGKFMILGDSIRTPNVFAEVDDGTYGTYQGVRIYKDVT